MELQRNELFDTMILYLAEAYARTKEATTLAAEEIAEKGTTNIKVPLPTTISIGSTRSGKTFVIAQIILVQMLQSEAKGKPIMVKCYRDLLTDCATKLFPDFVKAARTMGIEEKLRFSGGNKPIIRYGKSEIKFLGVSDEAEVQQAACDIAYFNEAFEIKNRRFVRQVVSRCTMWVSYDGNPTDSQHWLYDEMKAADVKQFHSTYRDNRFLKPTERHSIEQYCPWDLSDYIKKDGRWIWLLPEDQRKPNTENLISKTANRYDWLVKGEGIPSEREGAVFSVTWVQKFPKLSELDDVGFGLDFGWSGDETAFVMVGSSGSDLYIKELIYETLKGKSAIEKLGYLHSQINVRFNRKYYEYFTEEEVLGDSTLIEALGKTFAGSNKKSERKYKVYITCETQDNYKDVHFVAGLRDLATEDNLKWLQYYKISPKPRKYQGIANLQSWNLNVIASSDAQREFNNFTYRMIGDEATTILDTNKKSSNAYDHMIDATSYVAYDRFRKV